MKLYNEAIEVGRESGRRMICWRARSYTVLAVCGSPWEYRSEWWTGQEARRTYYTLETDGGRMMIFRNEVNGKWLLAQKAD